MENKKNRKVKLFLLGMIVLGVCNFVGIEQLNAQDKKETHITIKKGLNDEFLILSGNGPDVKVAECAEKICVETRYWCEPATLGYVHKVDKRIPCSWSAGEHHNTATLDPNNGCKANVIVHTYWDYGKGCQDSKQWIGSSSYRKSGCAKYRCVAWKAPADKVLSLMPLIGQAMIDVNLIEY